VVNLFVHWARVGLDGTGKINDFSLVDELGNKICSRYLNLKCQNLRCSFSHGMICYLRSDLQRTHAYLEISDFIYFLSIIFGSKFIWKYEAYIEELFYAYSKDLKVIHLNVSFKIVNNYCFIIIITTVKQF
jgi:hypothetical protein